MCWTCVSTLAYFSMNLWRPNCHERPEHLCSIPRVVELDRFHCVLGRSLPHAIQYISQCTTWPGYKEQWRIWEGSQVKSGWNRGRKLGPQRNILSHTRTCTHTKTHTAEPVLSNPAFRAYNCNQSFKTRGLFVRDLVIGAYEHLSLMLKKKVLVDNRFPKCVSLQCFK